MTAGELKKKLEQVPDEALIEIALDLVGEKFIFELAPSDKEAKALRKDSDGYNWVTVLDVEEFSWDACESKYWHLIAGHLTGY
jgi:hypothetical protein